VIFKTGGRRVPPSLVGSTPTRFRHCFQSFRPAVTVFHSEILRSELACSDKNVITPESQILNIRAMLRSLVNGFLASGVGSASHVESFD